MEADVIANGAGGTARKRHHDLVPETAERLMTWAEVDEDQVAFSRAILDEVLARPGTIAGANGKARREPGLN